MAMPVALSWLPLACGFEVSALGLGVCWRDTYAIPLALQGAPLAGV
jgi:hypothetical protein